MIFSWDSFTSMPLVGILRGFKTETNLNLAQQCIASGFKNIEVTLNSPDALESVARLSSAFSKDCNIGVGTVCSSDQVYESRDAGASFVVTPAVALDVIAACKELSLPVFCGAMTPSEALSATRAGADLIKLFPAAQLGPKYLAAIKAPLNEVDFLPTGGITPDNMVEYVEAGARGFGIGGSLFPEKAVADGDFAQVAKAAREFVDAYRQILDTK